MLKERRRNAAYLISVFADKYLAVLVIMVFVSISFVLRGQYWLSVEEVNVWSGVRCALDESEGLCWSGGVLLRLASSDVFFMLLCHYYNSPVFFMLLCHYSEDFIIVLMESRCEASGLMWWAGIGVCVTFLSNCHVWMIRNGWSGNNLLKYIGNQWFCSAGESFVMVWLWGIVSLV